MPGTPEKSAVWTSTQIAFGCDYYWKACYESRDAAEENFQHRIKRWCLMYGVQEKTEHSTAIFYCYYSTQRPVNIATYPQPEGNSPVMIINYNEDRWRPVARGRLWAWGEILYPHLLTREQMEDYELKTAPQ